MTESVFSYGSQSFGQNNTKFTIVTRIGGKSVGKDFIYVVPGQIALDGTLVVT